VKSISSYNAACNSYYSAVGSKFLTAKWFINVGKPTCKQVCPCHASIHVSLKVIIIRYEFSKLITQVNKFYSHIIIFIIIEAYSRTPFASLLYPTSPAFPLMYPPNTPMMIYLPSPNRRPSALLMPPLPLTTTPWSSCSSLWSPVLLPLLRTLSNHDVSGAPRV